VRLKASKVSLLRVNVVLTSFFAHFGTMLKPSCIIDHCFISSIMDVFVYSLKIISSFICHVHVICVPYCIGQSRRMRI